MRTQCPDKNGSTHKRIRWFLRTIRFIASIFIAQLLFLAACSIEISDATPEATVVKPASTATIPSSGAQTPTPTQTPAPLPWAAFSVGGVLVYTQGAAGIKTLDLATGEINSLFAPPDNTWLTAAAVSPDGKTIVMAYSPPPAAGEVQLGYTGLYTIPAAGVAAPIPEPLLERADPQESYFTPSWSPDGKYIYYARFAPIRSNSGNTFKYTVERIAYPGGKAEVVIENAIWPRLSPDGAKLAYLSFDPETYANDLYLANLDGSDPVAVIPPGTFPSVDAHFFSPDGKTIIFSAIGDNRSPALTWFERLMGVQTAEAHNVPSDWWSVTPGGGEPARLTELYTTGMYGDFSSDGQYIAFLSASGLYLMKPDGEDLTPLIPIEAIGTLEWIP